MPNPWDVGEEFVEINSDGTPSNRPWRVTAAGKDWCHCERPSQSSNAFDFPVERRALVFDTSFFFSGGAIPLARIEGQTQPIYWWHTIPPHIQRDITARQDAFRRELLRIQGGAMGQDLRRGAEITLDRGRTSRTLGAENSLGYLVVEVHTDGTLWVESAPAQNAGNALREAFLKAHEPPEPPTRFDRELEIDDA